MSPEVQQQAFEPFFTTKPAGQGTGLGLASVQAIVRRCGGQIELHSEVDHGTKVVCRLPAVDGTSAPRPASALRPEMQTPETTDVSGNETILVCEDDDAVRRLTVSALTKLGYRVVPAANGEAALEHAAELGDALDLVVTDVIMPGVSGSRLARHLRERRPELPMIFVSGYTADQLQRSDLSGPRNVLVNKPFSSTTLAAHIRHMLDQPASEGR
jgi:CheY-like chemotaxis protein